MKKCAFFVTGLMLLIAGCVTVSSVPIDGRFETNFEKTYQWLVKTNDPILKHGKDKIAKVYNAPIPFAHLWKDGRLTVILNPEESIQPKHKWVKVDKSTYQAIIPADENNTETRNTIKLISKDEYYLEVEVNGRITREYFKRQGKINSKQMKD